MCDASAFVHCEWLTDCMTRCIAFVWFYIIVLLLPWLPSLCESVVRSHCEPFGVSRCSFVLNLYLIGTCTQVVSYYFMILCLCRDLYQNVLFFIDQFRFKLFVQCFFVFYSFCSSWCNKCWICLCVCLCFIFDLWNEELLLS